MIEECLVVEVEVSGDGCPLADASAHSETEIEARPPQLRRDGYALLRFGTPDPDSLAPVLDGDDRIRYLHLARADGRGEFRCLSTEPCVIHDLVSAGFLTETLRYRDGTGRFTGAVVGHDVLQGVMDTAGETVGARLERVYPLGEETDVGPTERWGITRRQARALHAALEMGYFEVPRRATATDVAETLGISKTAFLERLRRGQATLLSAAL